MTLAGALPPTPRARSIEGSQRRAVGGRRGARASASRIVTPRVWIGCERGFTAHLAVRSAPIGQCWREGARVALTQGQQETIEAARAERAPVASPPLPQRSTPGSPWLACPPWPTRKVRLPQESGWYRACAAASTWPNSEGRPHSAECHPHHRRRETKSPRGAG